MPSSRACSERCSRSRFLACGPGARTPIDALAYMTLVTPEIVFAIAALVFFVQAGTSGRSRQPARLAHHPHRARRVQHVGRGARRQGALRLDGPAARRGVLRSRCRATLDVPPGHAAAARARDPRRRAACVHVLVRRLHHVVLRHRARTSETLPIYIWGQLRFGVTPAINATAAMMLALTLVAVVVAYLVLRRSEQGDEEDTG